MTRSSTIRLIRLSAFALVAIIILIYAVWRSLNYARGPEINIFQPSNSSLATSSTVTIVGQALRVSDLTLNGSTLSMDEHGNFTQTIIVFPGMNILTFAAKDQFGRTTKKEIDVVGTSDMATSTTP